MVRREHTCENFINAWLGSVQRIAPNGCHWIPAGGAATITGDGLIEATVLESMFAPNKRWGFTVRFLSS
jgi:hypothetical protein